MVKPQRAERQTLELVKLHNMAQAGVLLGKVKLRKDCTTPIRGYPKGIQTAIETDEEISANQATG